MKRALEISLQAEVQKKMQIDEEEEMIRRVMEMSEREENERVEKVRTDKEMEERKVREQELQAAASMIQAQKVPEVKKIDPIIPIKKKEPVP